MLFLYLIGLFDALHIHDTVLFDDEVVEGASTINSIGFLELLCVRQPIEKHVELGVPVRTVDRPRQ